MLQRSIFCKRIINMQTVSVFFVLLQSLCVVVARVDPIFFNYYPWRYNLSNVMPQNVYLPSGSPNFILPEVIDNRARANLQIPLGNSDVYPVYQFTRNTNDQKAKLIAESNIFQEMLPNQVTVSEMSCQNNMDELYFRATLSSVKNTEDPVIENAGSSSCKVLKYQSEYRIDFGKDEFWNCGVVDCSTDSDRHYCLKVRFPIITGLRLKDDFEVTLQCRAQKNVASHTRRINVKTIDTKARMAPRVAVGGHKSAFETEVALYRKTFGSEHVFDSKIESGGTVILGEETLLRAAVRDGDGWKYSKMSEVTVHYVENRQRKKIMNSLWILDADGCLNPQLAGISLGEQYRVGSLESYLLFKVFMFDSMQESDEIVLTVKVTGCLRGEDCILNCPTGHVRKTRQTTRDKREVGDLSNNRTIDWQNDITFRVIVSADQVNRFSGFKMMWPYFLSAIMLVILVSVLCIIEVFAKKRKRFYQ